MHIKALAPTVHAFFVPENLETLKRGGRVSAVKAFIGDANRSVMRFNSSSDLFSAYASGQDDVELYLDLDSVDHEYEAMIFEGQVMNGIGDVANTGDNTCDVTFEFLNDVYNRLSSDAKELFNTDEAFADARARMAYLQAWTAANTQSGGTIARNVISETPEKALSAALIIGLFGLTSLAGYYFLQKGSNLITEFLP